MTAIDAERAFAADAQTMGQWAAFRKWAAIDAVMFVPQPVQALDWLRGRPAPARAVEWWPTASFQSCDGHVAVNTGGWRRPDGSVGYFTTVWTHGWDGRLNWRVDHGDTLARPRPAVAHPALRRAACTAQPGGATSVPRVQGPGTGASASADGTLRWWYKVEPNGARRVVAELWTGRGYATVIDDRVAAAAS